MTHTTRLTDTLKLAVAIELLSKRISTMEIQISERTCDYSYEDVLDCIASMEFLNEHGKKEYNIREVKNYLNAL